MPIEQENGHMLLRRNFWISAVVIGTAGMSAWAEGNNNGVKPAPAPIVRTYVFPATGFALYSEIVRVTAINIAPNGHNGTVASCNGTLLIHDGKGAVLASQDIKGLLTGQIGVVDYPDPNNPPKPQIPGLMIRSEVQGSVQVTIDPANMTPCSLLLTLEVYDSATKATHALVTAAAEQPLAVTPVAFGRGQ